MVETITTKLAEYKAVTCFVTESRGAWQTAVYMLKKAQRQRKRSDLSSPNARRAFTAITTAPSTTPAQSEPVPVTYTPPFVPGQRRTTAPRMSPANCRP